MAEIQSDKTLLATFAQSGCEESFAVLVERYSGLVFHAALRSTGLRPLAEEATQMVFATLAKKAAKLSQSLTSLPAWLHRVTVLEAAKARRSEYRHQRRKDALMNEPSSSSETAAWRDCLPHLDEALNRLSESERHLVLWHYAEGVSFPEIAKRQGRSTTAVQKQGQRILAKLQRVFSTRGVTLTAVALASALSSEFVKAAPASVMTTLTPAALSVSPTCAFSIQTIIMTTKTKALTLAIGLLACGSPLAYQYHSLRALHEENSELLALLDDSRVEVAKDPGPRAQKPRSSKPQSLLDLDLAELGRALHEENTGLALGTSDYDILAKATSTEDLMALAGQIPDLEALEVWKQALHQYVLLKFLAEREPRLALEMAFGSPLLDLNQDSGSLSKAFLAWGQGDPVSAISWLDEKIASGALESNSLSDQFDHRVQFEAAAFSTLLSHDPSAAGARLREIPKGDRSRVFNFQSLLEVSPKDEPALVEIVRESFPPRKLGRVITMHLATLMNQGGYENVSRFIKAGQFTEKEKQLVVHQTGIEKIGRESLFGNGFGADDLESMQQFFQSELPEDPGQLAGFTLALFARSFGGDLNSSFKALREHYQTHQNEHMLLGFLTVAKDPHFRHQVELDQFLHALIPDPEVRKSLLDQVSK